MASALSADLVPSSTTYDPPRLCIEFPLAFRYKSDTPAFTILNRSSMSNPLRTTTQILQFVPGAIHLDAPATHAFCLAFQPIPS